MSIAGQIVKAAMTNQSLYTNVSPSKKTGYVEVMPGQQIRYDFSGIANNSTTSLTSFYLEGYPAQLRRCGWTRLSPAPTTCRAITGWSTRPTSAADTWRALADNLSTQQNYVLDASPRPPWAWPPTSMSHEFMVSFGVVPSQLPAGGGARRCTATVLRLGLPVAASSSTRRMWAACMTASGSWPPPGG